MAVRRPFLVPAPPEIRGERIQRGPIRAGDRIDVRLVKYLQHAVREEQWPAGTTFDEFLQSLATVIGDDRGGIFADHHDVGWRLTFVARSGIREGLDGGPFIIVLYDCGEERLVTAFQPTRGLEYVEDNARVIDGRWLTRLR